MRTNKWVWDEFSAKEMGYVLESLCRLQCRHDFAQNSAVSSGKLDWAVLVFIKAWHEEERVYRSSRKGFKSESTCHLILKQMKTLRTKFFLLLSFVCQMDSGFQKNSGICSCISESATAQKIDEIWKTNKAKGVKYLEHLIQLQKGARPTVISHSLWSERRQKYAKCGQEGH